jgi:hypothetical protein
VVREWAAHLPNGRLLTVRGAAHMPWVDAASVVYPALDRFLGGVWPLGAVHPTSADTTATVHSER